MMIELVQQLNFIKKFRNQFFLSMSLWLSEDVTLNLLNIAYIFYMIYKLLYNNDHMKKTIVDFVEFQKEKGSGNPEEANQ